MIVWSVPLYEINGKEGIRVASQIIYTHINSYAQAVVNFCQLRQQNVFIMGDHT